MDKNTTKSTMRVYLTPINHECLVKQIQQMNLDKYTKKLNIAKFIKLLIFAQLNQTKNLQDISLDLRTDEALQEELELQSISASQLSRKLRDTDSQIYEIAFVHLVQQIHRELGFRKEPKHWVE